VAIAKQLRALRPELEIDWLAQDPATRVLETDGAARAARAIAELL
jgi:hypothetical protein